MLSSNETEPPNPNSVAIMRQIDRMGKKWRELVHVYGFVIVDAMIDSLGKQNYESICVALEQRRETLQRQWLNTDFIHPHHLDGFKRGFRRMR